VVNPSTGEVGPPEAGKAVGGKRLRELGFFLPRSTAVSDRYLWVHDVGNRRVVRIRLGYRVTEEAILP